MAEARALRVLQLAAPAEFGGLERVVEGLASGLRRAGHDVHVAAVLDDGAAQDHPLVARLRHQQVSVHTLSSPARAYLRERRWVAKLCRELQPDVVHTHGYRPDVLHAPVAQRLGIPIVTTVHGFTGGDWKNRLYEWLQRRSLRRFDAVLAVSADIKDQVMRVGVRPERVHLLRNAWAADVHFLDRAAARQALGLPLDGVVLGWVGRLTHEKGADVALDALARLADLPLDLSFVGDGHDLATVRGRAAAAALSARVRFHGVMAGAGRLLPAFDVFVLSSRTEGTPIVLLEAMAAGVPVVATAVGGAPDVVSPAEAVLVPPDDPVALAAGIRTVVCDPQRGATRVRAARARLDRDFAVHPWLDRHLAVYHALR